MDATHVPYMDEFDIVGAFHVLEHIKDAAQRLSKRKPNPHYNLHNKLTISGLANWSMERVLGVERVFIKAGVSFPVGGSLLAVAYKPAETSKRS